MDPWMPGALAWVGAKKPGMAGLDLKMKWGSGGDSATAVVHHFGFERLDLTEDGEATWRTAHLALELVEDFVQPLSSGPEGRVVLSG